MYENSVDCLLITVYKGTMSKYFLSIDQGTTSSRVVLYDQDFNFLDQEQQEFKQFFPQEGWVEHKPLDIWQSVYKCFKKVIKKSSIQPKEIISIGITNQRETALLWDKDGNVLDNAIVWQDRRTSKYCDALVSDGLEKEIHGKTGLLLDPYFSATKVRWLMKEKNLKAKDCFFGTVDTFLIWKLTEGKNYQTDITNACRTLLYNINSLDWDTDLIKLFELSGINLPRVMKNCDDFGFTELFGGKIKISGVAGDQHASMIGQNCFSEGSIKSTYGTGCFLMANSGKIRKDSTNRLLSTIAYQISDEVFYALEGSIFMAGANFQWLRDKLEFFKDVKFSEELAKKANPNTSVFLIPSFVGLGAPHWKADLKAAIFGLTRDSGKGDISLAFHEAIAFQTKEIILSLEKDGQKIIDVRVDGGLTVNSFFNQTLSNIIQKNVLCSLNTETTALGAAFLSSIGSGESDLNRIKKIWKSKQTYKPNNKYNQERFEVWQKYLKSLIMN